MNSENFRKRLTAVKWAGAAAILALSAYASFALDVNPNQIVPTRQAQTQQTSYVRVTVNWNDPRISTGQRFARLPKNAFINRVACHVGTVFNAGSTNVFTLGTTSASANEIINASTSNQSINEASATFQDVTQSPGLGIAVTSAADTDIYAKYTQTGTPASTGQVICIIEFVPDNDN